MADEESLAPKGPLKLDTLAGIRTEQARVYRMVLGKKIGADVGTKLTYILKEIRCSIETAMLANIAARIDQLSERVERKHHGNGNADRPAFTAH